MASTKSDKINLDVVINGERAGKTLADLTAAQRALYASLKDLKIGSKEYMEQMEKLQKVNQQLSATRKEIKGVGDEMSHAKKIMLELGGALGIAFSVEKVIEFGKESVQAFMRSEKELHQLELTLRNISHEGVDAFHKLVNLSSELSEKSIFSGGEIQIAEKMLLTVGLTSDEVERLIPSLLDYASINNIELKDATENAIKAIDGKTKSLASTGDQFVDTGSKLENFNKLLEKFSGKYAGDAEESLDTMAGKSRHLSNQFEDLQTAIGSFFVDAATHFKDFIHSAVDPTGYAIDKGIEFAKKGAKKMKEAVTRELEGMSVDQLNMQVKLNEDMLEQQKQGKIKLSKGEIEAAKLTIQVAKQKAAEENDQRAVEEDEQNKKLAEKNKKLAEAQKKANEKELQEHQKLLDQIDKFEEEAFLKTLPDDQREVTAVRLKYKKLYEGAKNDKNAIVRLEKLEAQEIQDVRKKLGAEKEKQNQADWEAAITQAEEQCKNLADVEIKNQQDRLAADKQHAEDRMAVANALSSSLGSIAEIAANQGVQSAEFMKALALFQIGIDTAKGVSAAIAAGSGIPWPGNLVSIASGVATVLAGMANASRILSATNSPPAYAEGGPTFAPGGHVNKPFLALAGEKGREWIAPNWMVEDPKLAPMFDILENIRTTKTYAAGGSTTSSSTPKPAFTPSTSTSTNTNAELLMAVRQLTAVLQNGIQAKFDYDYYQKSTARIEAAKSISQIAK